MHGLKTNDFSFFNTKYLFDYQTRNARKNLLLNISWMKEVSQEQFLAILVSVWLELEDIYMENSDFYIGNQKERENFSLLIKNGENQYKENIKIQLLIGYIYSLDYSRHSRESG